MIWHLWTLPNNSSDWSGLIGPATLEFVLVLLFGCMLSRFYNLHGEKGYWTVKYTDIHLFVGYFNWLSLVGFKKIMSSIFTPISIYRFFLLGMYIISSSIVLSLMIPRIISFTSGAARKSSFFVDLVK